MRLLAVLVVVATVAALAAPATAAADERVVAPASAAPPSDYSLGPASRQALRRGFLVPDEARHAKAKRDAGGAGGVAEPVDEGPFAPVVGRGWNGVFDTNRAPSDSTSAVGTARFIQQVNSKFGIYNRTSSTPIATGTLDTLAGFDGNVFDPQIMWDGQTNRFYYAMDVVIADTDNRLAFGFSKTASPNSAADFCQYQINYGEVFPDYPKLGDTQDFIVIGTNNFGGRSGAFLGSEIAWLTKPAAGSTCPDASTFRFGTVNNLRDSAGAGTFTPVPANQLDPAPTGYAVARTIALPSTRLMIHKITRNPDGSANVTAVASPLTVPSYGVPADAKQKDPSTKLLDTLDARPTQAIHAINPARGGTFALWTQHTTAGGSGAQVRWYEIRPSGSPPSLFQSGRATSTAYSVFNGAISPDRVVNAATRAFGQNMVLNFNTSGRTTLPAVRQISKVGSDPQSPHALVKTSPGTYAGFDCAGTDNNCRWGDYAAANADPVKSSPDATRGRVWSTSMFASGETSETQANWRSWNWITTP